MMNAHVYTRKEWEERFAIHFRKVAGADISNYVIKAELESWADEDGNWLHITPEEAALENLSYWDDDGD